MVKTVHVIIEGRVQGVYYRASARDVAEELRLGGWVRNTADGQVECKVTGSEAQLQAFVEWCRRGPAQAQVSNVTVKFCPEEHFSDFEIRSA